MRTSFFLSLIAAGMLFVPSRIAAKAPEVPRDTSFTVWSTDKKIRKNHPEAVVAKPSLPDGVRAYNDVVYTTIKKTRFGDRGSSCRYFSPLTITRPTRRSS